MADERPWGLKIRIVNIEQCWERRMLGIYDGDAAILEAGCMQALPFPHTVTCVTVTALQRIRSLEVDDAKREETKISLLGPFRSRA
jgi:hypothetical protein